MSHSRRAFGLGLTALSASVLMPAQTWAKPAQDPRFILVILRGAMDGLHALPPIGDPDHARLRPTIGLGKAKDERASLPLTSDFGLHPALGTLLPLYQSGEISFIPATGTRYDQRSHFEAQDVLEGGGLRAYSKDSGWLNRALAARSGTTARVGLSLGGTVPLVLKGPAQIRTLGGSRLPDAREDFLFRAEQVYANDPLFAKAFAQAKMDMTEQMELDVPNQARLSAEQTVRAVTSLLSEPTGPRVAVLDVGGWDTHYAQLRRLNRQFTELANLITSLKSGMAGHWDKTAVLVVSEFGRTAAENGSGGTDHGTGGLAISAGGRLGKTRIKGEWPGLSPTALHEGRDVRVTTPMESIFMAVIRDHLRVSEARLYDHVFSDHKSISPLDGLFRA